MVSTLITNLDERVRKSPRFHANTLVEYFTHTPMRWWKPQPKGTYRENAYAEQMEIVASWLSTIQPHAPLELGPGFGRITRLIEHYSITRPTLIEINDVACAKLRNEFPHVRLIRKDFTSEETWHWGFCCAFDCVIAVEVLVHVPNIPQLLEHIKEALYTHGSTVLSITPLSWYETHGPMRPVIHRGVDEAEFEQLALSLFQPVAKHRSTNGQLLTYWFMKPAQPH